MRRIKRSVTVEQLVDIYKFHNEGYSEREITRKTGVPTGTINAAYKIMEKYLLRGIIQPKHSNGTYKRAVAIIRKMIDETVVTRKVELEPATPTLDKYDKIDKAFTAFQSSVQDFIMAEVDARVLEVQKKLDEATKKLQELEPVVEKAKTSNFVTNLREQWFAKGR